MGLLQRLVRMEQAWAIFFGTHSMPLKWIWVSIVPFRIGIFDLNGEGEAVGGIIVMRYGENADDVINKVKSKMLDVAKGLPQGVKFNIVYDRSGLIEESVSSIKRTLVEEMIVVSLVVIL